MNDSNSTGPTNPVPPYHDVATTERTPSENSTPLVNMEPIPESPQDTMHRKYPLKTISGILVLLITVLAVPVTVFLTQQQTRLFLEADTPTPTPTFPSSPTPTPTLTPLN